METMINEPFHRSLRNFATLTIELIQIHARSELKKGFNLIETLLTTGDASVITAIRCRYIAPLCEFLSDSEYEDQIADLLPIHVKEEYERQVVTYRQRFHSNMQAFVLYLN